MLQHAERHHAELHAALKAAIDKQAKLKKQSSGLAAWTTRSPTLKPTAAATRQAIAEDAKSELEISMKSLNYQEQWELPKFCALRNPMSR